MFKLEKYVCSKIVSATKLSLNDYAARCFQWNEQIHINGALGFEFNNLESKPRDELGYLVVYDIGEQTEYRSWSPAIAFEAGYALVQPKDD